MPESPLTANDTDPSISTPRLRLAFAWTGDRWTHAIGVDGITLVRPVELPPDQENPARVVSPAYQQLNFQEGPNGEQLALLVGQSGPHHFSAVFSVKDDGTASTIDIDIADRSRSPVEILAATFTVFRTSGDLIEADDQSCAWSIGPRVLRFSANAPTRASLAEAGRAATRVQATGLIDPQQKTQRCVYRWSLS